MKKKLKYLIFIIIVIVFVYNYIESDGLRLLPFGINLSSTSGQIFSICFMIYVLISYILVTFKLIRNRKYNSWRLSFIIFSLLVSYLGLCYLVIKSAF